MTFITASTFAGGACSLPYLNAVPVLCWADDDDDDDDDDDIVDPTDEEMIEDMYPDEDSRPSEEDLW